MTPAAALARMRAIRLALPRSAEKLSHGMPAFHVEKGRMFAYFWHDHHGDGRTAAIVKTAHREVAGMLIDAAPDRLFLPPYLGPSGWIGVHLLSPDTDWEEISERIAATWILVAPERRRQEAGYG